MQMYEGENTKREREREGGGERDREPSPFKTQQTALAYKLLKDPP